MSLGMRAFSMSGIIGLSLGLSAAAPVATQAPPTFDFPGQMDPADRTEIIRLYDVAAFDRELNMLTRRLDADAARQLQRGVESGRPSVQTSALTLLASALAQDALPADDFAEGISRALAAVVDEKEASPAADFVRLHARRVQWHLRVKALASPADRAAFLAPLLEQKGTDGVYYAYASVDYLADLGAEGAPVLRSFVAEGAKRSVDPEIMGRAQLGVRKIELSRQLELAGPVDAVQALAAAVQTPTKRQMDREFGKWVVGQLALHRPEAESELRALIDDERVTDDIRMAARFALTDDAKAIRWPW